jgi:aminopeptidase N
MSSAAKTQNPVTIFARDYQKPAFRIHRIDLNFDLHETRTRVKSRMEIRRESDDAGEGLVLDGQNLKLLSISLDGRALAPSEYQLTADKLTLPVAAQQFILEIENEIDPKANTALEGLYISHGMYCTQCEAEGFRNITYFQDRPDVMAIFSVRIEGDAKSCPVLLSNGNKVDEGRLVSGRHFVRWEDPFPKPAYLFALVAGDLACLRDEFSTRSGRKVSLNIYADARDLDKCGHAMASLKKAMKWDEEVFGLEYDLDIFNIVAVSHFNMGAMENKSLNIFNTKCVLAKPEVATDADFNAVEAVVAHEYFHNWTGNRVTCRDWFQLSLKEGLTVFRDQQFSADMGSRAVRRIDDVRVLRAQQFVEDAGPMAHPIRPDSYIEINNFYTATVYEKGAEVIRMMHTLLGAENFRKGMDLYFQRHDGQAVTCADFVAAMEDASGVDLGQFRLWYEQAGTPQLKASGHYDQATKTYDLTVEQSSPATPGQPGKKPMHMPLAIGLVGPDGRDMMVDFQGGGHARTHILHLREARQTFRFTGVSAKPVPSLLREFSAPVRLQSDLGRDDLTFLMAHDSDPFARFEAGQELAVGILLDLVKDLQKGKPLQLDDDFATAFHANLVADKGDKAFQAEMLTLPDEAYLAQQMEVIDVDAIHGARKFLRHSLAQKFRNPLLDVYTANLSNAPYSPEPEDMGRRALKNLALSYLMENPDKEILDLCLAQFHGANNMTDEFSALAALSNSDCLAWENALADFYRKWSAEALVIDKWFGVQAMSARADTLDRVLKLTQHPDFDLATPNRARALISSFAASNQVGFHEAGGRGYAFLADMVLKLDKLNPLTAARMVSPLSRWRRHDPARQALMKAELTRIINAPGLSPDVFEIVSKGLVA